jgi:hypothetical protein
MVKVRKFDKAASRSDLRLISMAFLLPGLAACGGNGSGTGGLTWPIDPITITQLNVPQIAGAAFDTLTGGTPLPAGVSAPLSTTGSSAITIPQKVAWLGRSAIQQLISLGKPYPSVVTYVCVIGGTYSIYKKNSTSEKITYDNCSNVTGETINGTLNMGNMVTTATSYSADTAFALTFATASPANTMNVDGDMDINMDLATNVETISGTNLWMGNTDNALGNSQLSNYTIATLVPDMYVTQEYAYASSAIGGTVDFQMDAANPFINTGGVFPSSGVSTITGANSTVIKLTVLGDENAAGNQLQFELSTDGGITYAAPTYDTWANITNLI